MADSNSEPTDIEPAAPNSRPRSGPSRVELWLAVVVAIAISLGGAMLISEAPWARPNWNDLDEANRDNGADNAEPTGAATLDSLIAEIEAIESERWSIKLAAMRHEVDHAILSYEIEQQHTTGLSANDAAWLAAYKRRKAAMDARSADLETFTFTVLNRRDLDSYNTLLLTETSAYEFAELDDTTSPASYGAQEPLKYTRPRSVLATRVDGRWYIGTAPEPDGNAAASNGGGTGNGNIPTDRGEQLRHMHELAAELSRLSGQLRGYNDDATRALGDGDNEAYLAAAVDGYTACYQALTAWERVRLLAHKLGQSVEPRWRQDFEETQAMLAVFDGVAPPSGFNPRTDARVARAQQHYEQARDAALGAIGE